MGILLINLYFIVYFNLITFPPNLVCEEVYIGKNIQFIEFAYLLAFVKIKITLIEDYADDLENLPFIKDFNLEKKEIMVILLINSHIEVAEKNRIFNGDKAGFQVKGIIKPIDIINKNFISNTLDNADIIERCKNVIMDYYFIKTNITNTINEINSMDNFNQVKFTKILISIRKMLLARELFILGIQAENKSLKDEALRYYTRSFRHDKNFESAYVKREKMAEKVLDDLNSAIFSEPDNSFCYFRRGIYYKNKAQYDRAISDFNMTIRLKPDYQKAYLQRGISFSMKGRFDLANKDFHSSLELDPDCSQAYLWLAINAYCIRLYDEAIVNCNKALSIKKDSAAAYQVRFMIYIAKGDNKKATKDRLKLHDMGEPSDSLKEFEESLTCGRNFVVNSQH